MSEADDVDPTDYVGLLEKLLTQLRRLPAPLRKKMEQQVRELIALVRDHRPPRFMLIGRRGAGKSTLMNGICGAKVAEIGPVVAQTGKSLWKEYEAPGGKKIEILDTRGVQEVAAVGTQALGEAAIAYFIDDKTIDEAKDAMRLASKKAES
jgi:predicted GTPase